MGALARPVGEADQLLLPFGRRANHEKNALLLILEPRLQVDAVRPDVNIAPGREIALLPAFVFSGPPLLQPRDGRCRQAGRILAEQRRQRLLEVAGRDALQVKDRDQHLQTLRAPCVRRKDRRREANAIGIAGSRLTIAHTRLARGDRTDTSHDLALGQAPMTHNAPMAVGGLEIGMLRQELRDLRLDGLGQQRARSVAQNLGELVIERPWLNQLDNAIVGQGISLLQWRVEASNTPTMCRLHRFTPSPTLGHSSKKAPSHHSVRLRHLPLRHHLRRSMPLSYWHHCEMLGREADTVRLFYSRIFSFPPQEMRDANSR